MALVLHLHKPLNPDAILYDPFSHKVFTFNGRSSNSTVIDANSNKVIGSIELPGKPEFYVTVGKGKVYVNLEDKSQICLINPETHRIYLAVAEFEAPPAETTENTRPRPAVKANTFTILEIEPIP